MSEPERYFLRSGRKKSRGGVATERAEARESCDDKGQKNSACALFFGTCPSRSDIFCAVGAKNREAGSRDFSVRKNTCDDKTQNPAVAGSDIVLIYFFRQKHRRFQKLGCSSCIATPHGSVLTESVGVKEGKNTCSAIPLKSMFRSSATRISAHSRSISVSSDEALFWSHCCVTVAFSPTSCVFIARYLRIDKCPQWFQAIEPLRVPLTNQDLVLTPSI